MEIHAVNNDTTESLLHCIFVGIMKRATMQTAYSNRYVALLWCFKYVSGAVFNMFAGTAQRIMVSANFE